MVAFFFNSSSEEQHTEDCPTLSGLQFSYMSVSLMVEPRQLFLLFAAMADIR